MSSSYQPSAISYQPTSLGTPPPRAHVLGTQHSGLRTSARRGTVLLMVVALLGMLFVVGAAFLQTVTFDARQIESEVESRQTLDAIDAIESRIFKALNDGWLAPNGAPYQLAGNDLVECIVDHPSGGCIDVNGNGLDDDYEVGPAYGELPHLHGLFAPLEPFKTDFEPTPEPVLPYVGDIGAAFAKKAVTVRDFASDTARIDLDNLPGFAVDADGDGIPDSRELDLTTSDGRFLPPRLRDVLLEQLNDPDADTNGIYLSVRAVPHGGMVDINWAHPELVYRVFDDNDIDFPGDLRQNGIGGPYSPENEEATLRHRGGLPQRRMAESALQRKFPAELLGALSDDITSETLFERHRWWFHSLGERPIDDPFWVETMESPNGQSPDFSKYDRRHVLTTYSTDSLLMRDGTRPDGRGRIEAIKEKWDFEPLGFGNWALDDYPAMKTKESSKDKDDPRKGRILISLPYLELSLLGDPAEDPGNGINSLQDRLVAIHVPTQTRARKFVRTIQDGFLLMLLGVDEAVPALTTIVEKERIAASLTANLIDFADADDIPTRIEIVDTNGMSYTPQKEYVYGLERQPFITEVYTEVMGMDDPSGPGSIPDPNQSFSGIELYNPYEEELDLTPFTLEVFDGTTTTSFQLTGSLLPAPSAIPGPNQGFRLCGLRIGSAVMPPGMVELSGSGPLLENGYTVRITRQHASSPPTTVVVDRFDVTGGSFYSGIVNTGQTIAKTIERAMWRMDTPNPPAYWTAVVPVTKEKDDSDHTLGGKNSWAGDKKFSGVSGKQIVRPVQVDFANTGSMQQVFSPSDPPPRLPAFPTTGTLLLLMRYANSESEPFNSQLAENAAGYAEDEEWRLNQYQIDNGRMPVFDTACKHRIPQLGSEALNHNLPMGYSYLPWGQFVFDYFTALPLDNMFDPTPPDPSDPSDPPRNIMPEVDLFGARVYGRVNLNAAPWPVLAGLPLVTIGTLPASYKEVLRQFTYGGAVDEKLEDTIGEGVAKAIVAYRDARRIPGEPPVSGVDETGDFQKRGPPAIGSINEAFSPDPIDFAGFNEIRKGSGFLTVGELANVRHWDIVAFEPPPDEDVPWRFDEGVIGRTYTAGTLPGYPAEDYVQAVGLLVALGDWVTTRSNVWTIYGTLRGYHGRNNEHLAAVDKRAIRFEETVDRLPCFLKPGAPPRRIGERKVGAYNDTRSD